MPHIALLSSPAHFTPMVELGKRLVALVTCQNVKVTIFVTSFLESAPKISSMVKSAQSANLFDVIQLPPADISGLINPAERGLASLPAVVRASKPALRSAISALKTPPTALIVHIYAVDGLEIADELNIPKFVYVSTHAWYLALLLYIPIIDKAAKGEFGDGGDEEKAVVPLPGCTPVRVEDLPDPILIQTRNNYLEFIRMGIEIAKADGILVNTMEELQPSTLASLRDDKLLGGVAKAPIFPIGPIIAEGAMECSKTELFEWLNNQPNESVLYISFGSMGMLSLEQITELAWGLELSQQRFIWVVRPPNKSGNSDDDDDDMLFMSSFLPQGFVARTRDRGLLVPHWAPQVEILSHPSCGGFLTHCGWNSTMECIANGLPMIAWPLYAEQRMNATLLTEELGIAVRSKTIPSKGVVGREEIETMVKQIFVDEKIRERVKELKLCALKAWEIGGSSYNALAQFVKLCCES